ncbi:hypothetical protein Dimus_029392 [Dionaea muscipula]
MPNSLKQCSSLNSKNNQEQKSNKSTFTIIEKLHEFSSHQQQNHTPHEKKSATHNLGQKFQLTHINSTVGSKAMPFTRFQFTSTLPGESVKHTKIFSHHFSTTQSHLNMHSIK